MLFRTFALFVSIVSCVLAVSVHGSRTLVVYDDRITNLNDYSNFFGTLESNRHQINYVSVGNVTANDVSFELFQKDEKVYDNLILFPVKGKHLNRKLPAKKLLQFFEAEGDILAVTSPKGVTDSIRLFFNQLGIYPSPKNSVLKDYFSENSETPSIVKVDAKDVLNEYVYDSKNVEDGKQLIFDKSSAALLDNNEQIVPILHASRTSFTQQKGKDVEHWTDGTQGYLVASFQSLVNSRATWLGTEEFLSNKYYDSNGDFAQELAKWTFREKSVIRITSSEHYHIDSATYEQRPYKIKDDIIYNIGFSEWNGENWQPFHTSDIQFILKMVDPYYRFNLVPSQQTEDVQYYTTNEFKLPDQYGVFTFLVDYKRNGLTFVTESDIKAIRHLTNDEYPRSWEITNSWVYLSAVFIVISSWLVFVVLFLTTSAKSKTVCQAKKNN